MREMLLSERVGYYAAIDPWVMPRLPTHLLHDLQNMRRRCEQDCAAFSAGGGELEQDDRGGGVARGEEAASSERTPRRACEIFPVTSDVFSPALSKHRPEQLWRKPNSQPMKPHAWSRSNSTDQSKEKLQDHRAVADLRANPWKRVFDLVFIDSDHSYGSVRKDIQRFARMVKRGGILAGHDLHPDHYITSIAILQELAELWRQVKEYEDLLGDGDVGGERRGRKKEKLKLHLLTDGTWWVRWSDRITQFLDRTPEYLPQDSMWAKFRDT
eukprot:g11942.t1